MQYRIVKHLVIVIFNVILWVAALLTMVIFSIIPVLPYSAIYVCVDYKQSGIATAILTFFVLNIILYLFIYCVIKVSAHHMRPECFCASDFLTFNFTDLIWWAVDLVGHGTACPYCSILGDCLPLLRHSHRVEGKSTFKVWLETLLVSKCVCVFVASEIPTLVPPSCILQLCRTHQLGPEN